MKKIAFTIVEILVALIILAILVSVSIAGYQRTIAQHKVRLCQENLKVILSAIDVYTVENDALPNSLAMLEPRQIRMAYLKVLGKPKENRMFSFLNNILGLKSAWALLLPSKFYGNNPEALKCPADTSGAAVSYSINTAVFSSVSDYTNPANSNTAMLYDTDTYHNLPPSSNRFQIGITPIKVFGERIVDQNGTEISNDIFIPQAPPEPPPPEPCEPSWATCCPDPVAPCEQNDCSNNGYPPGQCP